MREREKEIGVEKRQMGLGEEDMSYWIGSFGKKPEAGVQGRGLGGRSSWRY